MRSEPSSTTTPELDLRSPSRRGWAQLCRELDRLDPAELAARTPELDARLAHWPARLRLAPGRWLARLLGGRPAPGLALARRASLTCFAEVSHVDRFAWADTPELRSLHELEVYDDQLDNRAIARLVARAEARPLRRLCLRSAVGIDDEGVEQLVAWPGVAALETLDLARNRIGARGLAALLRAPTLAGLRRLHLGRNRIDAIGIIGLAGSERPAGLELLDVDHNRIDGEAVAILASAPVLEHVRELVLSGNPIGRRGCEALAASPYLRRIERLFLHACELDDHDIEPLLNAPELAGIENLALSGNRLTMRSVEALAAAVQLDGIAELDVCHNEFVPDDAHGLLAAAPALARLRRLCV